MTDNLSVPYAAPPPPPLVDTSGRPLRAAYERLTREVAAPTIAGIRSIQSGHPAQGLDPQRLAQILRAAETGDATAYLELAEELEDKWPHYRSVLRTRKLAVAQQPITVEAAGDSDEEEADAQLIRDWLKRLTLQGELIDIMDALGKGYSAIEVIWSTTALTWLPDKLKWRHPQFFEFDQVTGEELLLRGGEDGMGGMPEPLSPFKYIVHTCQEKSGTPIRSGIARAAAWYYLFLNFTIKDWVTFLEVYGLPLRVGKYANGTSEEDIRKLAQAVAQIGSDAGCVIPQSMVLEFVQAGGAAANPEMFWRFLQFVNDEISKLVLGQTSSADAKSGGLGTGQADLHGEVRKDIRRFDETQLSVTLTATIGKWIVQFNRGHRERYPIIRVGEPDPVDMDRELKAIDKAVEYGVPVGMTHFRKVTGVPAPEDGEELLAVPKPDVEPDPGTEAAGTPPKGEPGPSDPEPPRGRSSPRSSRSSRQSEAEVPAAISSGAREPDAIDRLVDAGVEDWADMTGPMIGAFEELIAAATSMEEVRELLALRAGDAIAAMPVDRIVELGARAGFAARIAGLVEMQGDAE
jgi:phage gp29-like protein